MIKVSVVGVRGLNYEGGIESYCRYLYPEIAALGYQVTIYTRRRYEEGAKYGHIKIKTTRSIEILGMETLSHTIFALAGMAFHGRPDVVHFQAIGPALFAPLARFLGCAVVVRHVGNDWERQKWGWLGRTVLRLAERSVARFADVVVCLNDEAAAAFRTRWPESGEVNVIQNAVPRTAAKFGRSAVDRYALTPGRYVLAVSRLTPEKGLDVLMDAFTKSGLAEQGWRLAIAGRIGRRNTYTRALAAQAVRTKGAVLLGEFPSTALAELFAHAGMFASASFHEGMSFSILEALSHGLPCIVTDISANAIPCRGYATLVPPGDADALGAMLMLAAQNPMTDNAKVAQRAMIARFHDLQIAAQATAAALTRSVELASARRDRTSRSAAPKHRAPN